MPDVALIASTTPQPLCGFWPPTNLKRQTLPEDGWLQSLSPTLPPDIVEHAALALAKFTLSGGDRHAFQAAYNGAKALGFLHSAHALSKQVKSATQTESVAACCRLVGFERVFCPPASWEGPDIFNPTEQDVEDVQGMSSRLVAMVRAQGALMGFGLTVADAPNNVGAWAQVDFVTPGAVWTVDFGHEEPDEADTFALVLTGMLAHASASVRPVWQKGMSGARIKADDLVLGILQPRTGVTYTTRLKALHPSHAEEIRGLLGLREPEPEKRASKGDVAYARARGYRAAATVMPNEAVWTGRRTPMPERVADSKTPGWATDGARVHSQVSPKDRSEEDGWRQTPVVMDRPRAVKKDAPRPKPRKRRQHKPQAEAPTGVPAGAPATLMSQAEQAKEEWLEHEAKAPENPDPSPFKDLDI